MNFTLKKSDLNFKVYTVPSKPTAPGADNDIAIISSVPMTNWIMSPESPSGIPRTDGDVWIRYSVSGDTRNILTQNSMLIAMITAYQYVDGAWVGREAVSCRGGEWVDWAKYLYDSGTFYTPFVKTDSQNKGGYTTKNTASLSKGSVSFNDDHIYMYAYEVSGGNCSIQFCGTDNKIDMAGFTKLNVEFRQLVFTRDGRLLNYVMVSASPDKTFPGDGVGSSYQKWVEPSINGPTTFTVDISDIDSAYVVITTYGYLGGTSTHGYISKIWLE